MKHQRIGRKLIAGLTVLGVALAACGGDDDGADPATPETTTAPEPDESPTTTAPGTDTTDAPTTDAPTTEDTTAPDSADVAPFDPPIPIRMGLQNPNFTVHGSVLVALELGVFEEWGLDIEVVNIGSAEGRVLLAQGDLDLQVGTIDASFFNGIEQDLDMRCIAKPHSANPEDRSGMWARPGLFADPDNPTGDELVGALVGTAGGPASSTMYFFDLMLQELYGIDITDVELQQMGSPEMLIALENEAIDVGFLIAPYWQEAEAAGDMIFLGNASDHDSAVCVVAGDRLLNAEPEIAAVYLAAMQDSNDRYLVGDFMEDETVLQAIVDGSGIEIERVRTFVPLLFEVTEMAPEMIDGMQTTFRKLDLLIYDPNLPWEQVFDRTALDTIGR